MISATATELLSLICIKPIPVGKCDRLASIQLLRAGYIERQSEMTNTLKGSSTFIRYRYWATARGKEFDNARTARLARSPLAGDASDQPGGVRPGMGGA